MSDGGTDSLPLVGQAARAVATPGLRPQIGTRLGRYQIVSPLASGGMAEVWIAKQIGDLGFQRQVALKTIRAEFAAEPSFKRSFLEEARVASRLHHANVVEVLDLGEDAGIFFLAMPLIDGPSLKILEDRRGPVPLDLLWRVALDALAGLEAAHQLADDQGTPMKLIHRDVSPQNILLGSDGVAKLADFGVAKALGRLVDETEAGQLRGKLGYLSPEQVGRRPVDQRSDLYSMAVVLWELAARRRLFKGEDLFETFNMLVKAEIPDLRTINPDVPVELVAVIDRALSLNPDDRPASARAFAEALELAARTARAPIATHRAVAAYLRGPIEVGTSEEPTSLVALAPVPRRSPTRMIALALGAALLSLGVGLAVQRWSAVEVDPVAPEPVVAEESPAPREPPPLEARPAPDAGAAEIAPEAAPVVERTPRSSKAAPSSRARPRPKFSNPYSK